MVSLQKYTSRGYTYYRLVESRRIDGKPTPVLVKHLGSAENILRLITDAARPVRMHSYAHGHVAALVHAANELGVAAEINRHAQPTDRGQDVGTTLVLAAVGRALHPTSKRAWADWARTTSLPKLAPGLDVDEMTSQYFWDQMDAMPQDAVEAVEDALTRRVVETYDLELDTLFYDTTNFFTHIDTTNARNTIARRGKNKQKRHDLRQVGLALLVHRGTGIPLTTRTYQGNTSDAALFPETLTQIRKRVEDVAGSVRDVTLVYDRGNNSKENQARVDAMELHYVAALTPSQHEALLPCLPEADDEAVEILSDPFEGMRAVRFTADVWGRERTLVAYRSRKLQEGQSRGLDQSLAKALERLTEWRQSLGNPRAGPRSQENADKQIQDLLKAQHVARVLRVTYDAQKEGGDRLAWRLDLEEVDRLKREVYGLRLLMTDQDDWPTEAVIRGYHGQSEVEGVFRCLKDVDHFSLRPQYHWTDQKIRVHVFTCILGYLLSKVVEFEARDHGWRGSLQGLLDDLERVRLAVVASHAGGKGRPRVEHALEDTPGESVRLFRRLVPEEPPFVYTLEAAV